jgi:hypothetical protein
MVAGYYALWPTGVSVGDFTKRIRKYAGAPGNSLTSAPQLEKASADIGMSYTDIGDVDPSSAIRAMADDISAGMPVIAFIDASLLGRTYKWHWVVVTGFSPDASTIYINDPDENPYSGTYAGGRIQVSLDTFYAAVQSAADQGYDLGFAPAPDDAGSGNSGGSFGPSTITLSADQVSVSDGQSVTLSASTNQPLDGTGDIVQILDENNNVIESCDSGQTCSAEVALDSDGEETYTAYLYDQDYNLISSSAAVSIIWSSSGGTNSGTGELGGLDLDSYCQSIGYVGASLDGYTAYDWHCDGADGSLNGIDMKAACQWQYSWASPVTAQMGDVNDPSSWKCFEAEGSVG